MARLGSRGRRGRAISATGIAVLCILAAFFFLVFVPRKTAWVYWLENKTTAIMTPLYSVASAPFQKIREWQMDWSNLLDAHEQNEALRGANKTLNNRLGELDLMRAQLKKYQDLLALPLEPDLRMASARVVADLNSPFVHTLLANNGSRAGIAKGQAVIGAHGLVGRIFSSNNNAARILLLTDFNSHIPVITHDGATRAILSGRNQAVPILSFLSRQATLADGDQIVTSGAGGYLPAGIPVGTITIEDNQPHIMLHEDLTHLDYVRIILSAQIK
ncbi:MAG: rod shape-determining protein MreC [Alphaproteobacteria bacterium]|nr:rod shape-determining protein MreC [Alphaproteobacteria bacterium]MBE8220198.1 rod shape-determining protein MreC [Alphaproteobacteria bacterium]